MKRTQETARHIEKPFIMQGGYPFMQMKPRVFKNLDEIYAGACDGMTYDQIKQTFSKEASCRAKDKLTYRYPRGTPQRQYLRSCCPSGRPVCPDCAPLLPLLFFRRR